MFDPGVSLKARRILACAETQLGGNAAAPQNMTQGRGLLEAVGTDKKMVGGGRQKAGNVSRLHKSGRICRGVDDDQTALEKSAPTAKADQAQGQPGGRQPEPTLKNEGSLGPRELPESPQCAEERHKLRRRPVASPGL
jgi:hypothetical protein